MYLIVHADDETYFVPFGEDFDLPRDMFKGEHIHVEPYIADDVKSGRHYLANMLGWDMEGRDIPVVEEYDPYHFKS